LRIGFVSHFVHRGTPLATHESAISNLQSAIAGPARANWLCLARRPHGGRVSRESYLVSRLPDRDRPGRRFEIAARFCEPLAMTRSPRVVIAGSAAPKQSRTFELSCSRGCRRKVPAVWVIRTPGPLRISCFSTSLAAPRGPVPPRSCKAPTDYLAAPLLSSRIPAASRP
jgi:hypothetical protein